MADYFDHYQRGRTDGMPWVDEFGSHLGGTRFATAGLLAFLHDLPVLSDVPTTRVVFTVLCLVIHFFSMLALSRVLIGYANWHMPLLAAFLASAGGWLAHAMTAANNDNLIFAALTPALLALWCAPRTDGGTGVRWPVVLASGLLLGAMIYNYPEGMALLGILCIPLAAAMLWPKPGGKFLANCRTEIFGAVLGVLLAVPYLPTFVSFLRHQITTGLTIAAVARPNEGIYPGLIVGARLPAAFALGEEIRDASHHFIGNLLPLCLIGLLILGLRVIGRHQKWFPWTALPLAILFFWQNIIKHFDYGTFKVLLTAAWWIYPAISAGLFWITERYAWSAKWSAALVAGLLFAIGLAKYEHRSAPMRLGGRIKPLQELSTLHFVTGNSPVLLSLDDDFDHLWASYYLRGLPLATWRQRNYLSMPHITPLLARGIAPAPESCAFMLVSGSRPDALWHNSRFSLVVPAKLFIASVKNPPNGVETLRGEQFLWLSTQAATLEIVSSIGGDFELRASAFGVGPGLPGQADATVEITDARGMHPEKVTNATRSLPVTLAPGNNEVRLHVLGSPAPGQHNGDSRELMVGIHGLKVTPRDR